MIRINIAETREVARLFREKGNEIEQVKSLLDSELQGLYGVWEGMAEENFMADYQQADQILIQARAAMDQVATALETIANNFEQADTTH
ncbi:MAG: WXG100 family type VII secretion target [Actinobacteria bacterium]|nr:WXG100 family type VII secretion target [Actinomycetota bacterium]